MRELVYLSQGKLAGLGSAAQRFIQDLGTRVHPETAAWMKGYARLTANVTHPPASRLPGMDEVLDGLR